MKLSELINRLEEIKGSEGDMDVAKICSTSDWFTELESVDLNVEKVDFFRQTDNVSLSIKTDLALFIG